MLEAAEQQAERWRERDEKVRERTYELGLEGGPPPLIIRPGVRAWRFHWRSEVLLVCPEIVNARRLASGVTARLSSRGTGQSKRKSAGR
jgi:hypothetical protein